MHGIAGFSPAILFYHPTFATSMARSFRKIALSLGSIVLLSAIAVTVYLGWKFGSRSNLVRIVPPNAEWVYVFQTREIRDKVKPPSPPYFDSFADAVKKLPLFKNIRDPKETGLALYSDLVMFKNTSGWFLALSVNSNAALKKFLKSNTPAGIIDSLRERNEFTWVPALHSNLYFAFDRHRCFLYVPSDTARDHAAATDAMAAIFAEKASLSDDKEFDDLFRNNDIIWYRPGGAESHGVLLETSFVKFSYPSKKAGNEMLSPLFLLRKAGRSFTEAEIDALLKPDNKITQTAYLNESFRLAYQHLKPYLE